MRIDKSRSERQLVSRNLHYAALWPALRLTCLGQLVFLLLFSWATPSSCATVEEIVSAWERYDAAVITAQCHCTFDRIEAFPHTSSNGDPYERIDDSGPPPEPIILHRKLVVSISGKHLASDRTGEVWDMYRSVKVNQQRAVGFDGKETRALYPGADLTLGVIYTGTEPDEILGNSAEMRPFLLSFFPAVFLAESKGVTQESLVITAQDAGYTGEKSITLEVLTSPGDSLVVLHVDPNHGYRIQSMEERVQGVKRAEITLSYMDDAVVGWVLSSWQTNYFRRNARPRLTIRGRVTEYSIGDDIPTETFHPVFPVGTHVTKDGETYIQKASGLEKLAEEMYGRLPKSTLDASGRGVALRRTVFMITGVAVIILGILVLRKYQANPR